MFKYYQPTKIHFGENSLENLGTVCKKYGGSCLLVTTPDEVMQDLYTRVKHLLGNEGIKVTHFQQVTPNPKTEIIEEAYSLLKSVDCDFILAVGGGSSIDTAKAISFVKDYESLEWTELFDKFNSPKLEQEMIQCIPVICVPTTSGTGSQVTQASVLTSGNEKITFFHDALFPRECVIDPTLMLTLPSRMSAATGFDAFTHAFESYINASASYLSMQDSLASMRLVVEFLPKVLSEPHEYKYREAMALADTLGGRALANSGADVPHPLSEIIGGKLNIAHGVALSLVFVPYLEEFYDDHVEKFDRVHEIFKEFGYRQDSLHQSVRMFLDTIGLCDTLDTMCSLEDKEAMLNHPVLSVLPFASKDRLVKVLKNA